MTSQTGNSLGRSDLGDDDDLGKYGVSKNGGKVGGDNNKRGKTRVHLQLLFMLREGIKEPSVDYDTKKC